MKKHSELHLLFRNIFVLMLLLSISEKLIAETDQTEYLVIEKPLLKTMGLFESIQYKRYLTVKDLPEKPYAYLKLFYETEQMESIIYLPDIFYNEMMRKIEQDKPEKIQITPPENQIFQITLKSGSVVKADSVQWTGFYFVTHYMKTSDTIRVDIFDTLEETERPFIDLDLENITQIYDYRLFIAQTAHPIPPFSFSGTAYEIFTPEFALSLPLNILIQASIFPYTLPLDEKLYGGLMGKITILDFKYYDMAFGYYNYTFNGNFYWEIYEIERFLFNANTFNLGSARITIGLGVDDLENYDIKRIREYYGAEIRMTMSTKLLLEYWKFLDKDDRGIFGFRQIWKGHSMDFGFKYKINRKNEFEIRKSIPFISFTYIYD